MKVLVGAFNKVKAFSEYFENFREQFHWLTPQMTGGPGSGQPGLGTQGEQEQLQQAEQDPLPEEQECSQGLYCEEHEGKLLMVLKQQAKFLLKCCNKFVNYEHVLSLKL